MTKSELKSYVRMNVELKRLEDKLTELRAMIEAPRNSALTGMPKCGNGQTLEDRIYRLIDLQEMYNTRWDRLIDERIRIEWAVDTLTDPVERALMGYKYIDGLTWEEVCVKINYGWVQTHKLHSAALGKLKE